MITIRSFVLKWPVNKRVFLQIVLNSLKHNQSEMVKQEMDDKNKQFSFVHFNLTLIRTLCSFSNT